MLLVALTGFDVIFGRLGLSDGLLDGDEPSIALWRILSLKGVLVARNLECKGNGAILDKVGCVGLLLLVDSFFSAFEGLHIRGSGHQRGAPSGRRA